MARLRELVGDLGAIEVGTYLQSGNVTFSADRPQGELEAILTKACSAELGARVDVLVRSAAELATASSAHPFFSLASENRQLHVTFLQSDPGLDLALASGLGEDRAERVGREVYLFCPGGYGRTKLTNSFFERRFKVTATTRNWNTVTALAALVGAGRAPR